MKRLVDKSWEKIFYDCKLDRHDFSKNPAIIKAQQIKNSCQNFKETGAKEVRILCKQDTREKRPKIFQDNNLFLLPKKNGIYYLIQGEGYLDIPQPTREKIYHSKINFNLDTSKVGDSEMQHLDYAYAVSLVRSFVNDSNLLLTIRGRKYTPQFDFYVQNQKISVQGVQTEVDAGYESDSQVILVEAKNTKGTNTIIRQLYYPFRQWQTYTKKPVKTLFFEKEGNNYSFLLFRFRDTQDYNSIELVDSVKYKIQ